MNTTDYIQKRDKFPFAIQMTQAKDPKEMNGFRLWVVPIHNPAIECRLQQISGYLEENGVHILKENL